MSDQAEPIPANAPTQPDSPSAGAGGTWLEQPLGEIFETSAQKRFVDAVSIAGGLALLVGFTYSLATEGSIDWVRWGAFWIGLLGFVSAPIAMRWSDSVSLGALLVLATGIALIVVPAYYQGGASAIFTIWFLLIPLLAGLLLGPRPALISGGVGAAVMTGFYLLETSGQLPTDLPRMDPFMAWLNLVLGIAFSTAVGAVSARSFLASSERLLAARRAEAAKTRALEESRVRYRASIDAALDAIVTVDEAGRIVEFNPAAEKMFGKVRNETLDSPLDECLIPERMRAAYRRAFRRYLETGEKNILGRKLELQALRFDGSEFPVELIVQPHSVFGQPHFSAYLRDLTEHYAAEKELREAEQELSQARRLEAIGRLAGGVSHDFNNLLLAINGHTELLLARSDLDGEARECLEQIAHAGQQAASVTQQLLAFSSSGELSPTLTDTNQQVRDLIGMLERLLPESIRVRTELEPHIWPLKTDAARLEQALLNLVLNAGDAMPNGGELTLATRNVTLDDREAARIEGLQAGEHVQIRVSDSGRGMDEDTASRAFEPFFTTKDTGEGTGLGLATTYGSIRQSGGAIQVSSDEGRGSTFTVLLPRAVDPSAAAEEGSPSPVRGQGETVLIVEDQPTLRQLLQRALEGQGYRVLLAADGVDAVELAGQQQDPIELVITDMVMPRLGGGATVARLRETHPDLKAIFISGYAGEFTENSHVADKRAAFLQKPFRLKTLCAQVRELLDYEKNRAAGENTNAE